MERELIVQDYEPTTQKLEEAGFILDKTMEFEEVILHVRSDIVYYSLTEHLPIMAMNKRQLQSESVEGVKKTSQYYKDKFQHKQGDETIQNLLKEVEFAESILKAREGMNPDIIIMSSLSRKWLDKI